MAPDGFPRRVQPVTVFGQARPAVPGKPPPPHGQERPESKPLPSLPSKPEALKAIQVLDCYLVVEVPPVEGTLLVFRRSNNSWHGHKPFIGPRRVVQFNWITTQQAAQRQLARHSFTAWIKKLRSRFHRPQPAM